MHHCCCDPDDDYYFKRKIQFPAHCSSCRCSKSALEVSHEIRMPKKHSISRKKSSCHCFSELMCCCPYDILLECDSCLCFECQKIRGRSEALIHKKDRRSFTDNRYTLLETWFTRFDSDGDGYLDIVDVESLFKYLGAKIHNSSTKKILQMCDKDCDGRLSFPEFVCLWHRAAHHDDDFIKTIRCPDLSHIVKKYKLFSEVHYCPCLEHRCKHITIATEHPIQQIKCKCGQRDKVIPYIKQEDLVHSSKKHAYKFKAAAEEVEDSEELPTMSKNRDDII